MSQDGQREVDYTIRSLEQFLDGTGGEWDWDDFTSRPLKDHGLNEIRKAAGAVSLPLADEDRIVLRNLLSQARTFKVSQS